eukprot:TRINITY_DN22868_c0_g1_i10.p1 TRINITY_DN22868_c0_g1~~TRINITY_DN22868_c0_g1_i10.p1  ORF type:complete len:599 (-),score=73.78 TRINITY_DN22868_c0_g1_i10:747-2543(-)
MNLGSVNKDLLFVGQEVVSIKSKYYRIFNSQFSLKLKYNSIPHKQFHSQFIGMDQDELLAKQLQLEEFKQQQLSGGNFENQIGTYVRKAMKYEDPICQAQAMSVIPEDQIMEDAQEMVQINEEFGGDADMGKQDYVAQALLKWFKSYFSWVDKAACEQCGHPSTVNVGVAAPNDKEKLYEASRVELYKCTNCQAVTRFPRYNDPGILLSTRKGRCGEWANAFTLCCRAIGLKARIVIDWTDHVWTEYYSAKKQRWIHLDPCECSYDQPLLYESGWGKKLNYAIGFSIFGVRDVTKRYTRKWDVVKQRRNLVNEDWLAAHLNRVTQQLRGALADNEKQEEELVDQYEKQELESSQGRKLTEEERNLPGRQTGSKEWRSERGEEGNTSKNLKTRTSYRFCKSENTSDDQRLRGGAVRASGENAPNELAINLFDGRNESKWLDFGGGGEKGTAWVEYRLRTAQQQRSIVKYNVMSANDSPERDPCDWILFAIHTNDQGMEVETEIDQRSEVQFSSRHQLLSFQVAKQVPAQRWKFFVSKTRQPKIANSIQLARLEFFVEEKKESTFEQLIKSQFEELVSQGKSPDQAAAEALQFALSKVQK